MRRSRARDDLEGDGDGTRLHAELDRQHQRKRFAPRGEWDTPPAQYYSAQGDSSSLGAAGFNDTSEDSRKGQQDTGTFGSIAGIASDAVSSAASSIGSSIRSVVPALVKPVLRRGNSTGALSSFFGASDKDDNMFSSNLDTDMDNDTGWSFSGDWNNPNPVPSSSDPAAFRPHTDARGVRTSDLFKAALKSSPTSVASNRSKSSKLPGSSEAPSHRKIKASSPEPPNSEGRATKQQRYSTSTGDVSAAFKKTISCPDFAVFEAQNVLKSSGSSDLQLNELSTESDRKRARRLARNRASARLRRQRKRSTIENLESKVEDITKKIEKLTAYHFGSGLDRGSELTDKIGSWCQPANPPTSDERVEETSDLLRMVCCDLKVMLNNQTATGLIYCAAQKSSSGRPPEHARIQLELQNVLQLTPEQRSKVTDHHGALMQIGNRYTTLCALLRLLVIADQQAWLKSSIHESANGGLKSIVTPDQKKRFATWSDRNKNAIKLLRFYRPTEDERQSTDRESRTIHSYWRSLSNEKPLFYFGGKGSVYH